MTMRALHPTAQPKPPQLTLLEVTREALRTRLIPRLTPDLTLLDWQDERHTPLSVVVNAVLLHRSGAHTRCSLTGYLDPETGMITLTEHVQDLLPTTVDDPFRAVTRDHVPPTGEDDLHPAAWKTDHTVVQAVSVTQGAVSEEDDLHVAEGDGVERWR